MTETWKRARDGWDGPQEDDHDDNQDDHDHDEASVEVEPLRAEARTDEANARRFVAAHGDRFRYSGGLGWLAWDGARWARDEREKPVRAASQVGHRVIAEAASLTSSLDEETGKDVARLLGWGVSSLSAARIEAMVKLARNHPRIVVTVEELDADPWLLNVRNGTIDLRTGKLGPHDRADLITKLAPVSFDPDASASKWEAFLERVLPDPEVRGFLRRLVGYALIGSIKEHVLPILWGTGQNGKSTLVETLLSLLGDYGTMANRELLTVDERGHGEHPTQVARLRGARLVGSVEVEAGRRLSESLVKQLTGGDRMAARYMRRDFFEIIPSWTILYAVNHKPVVWGSDFAIWRRLLLVPFTITIPEAERDRDLPAKLMAEAPGVLNWALRGCREYQERHLGPPEAVVVATESYRQEMDVIGDFLADCCVEEADAMVPYSDLYRAYADWCDERRARPVSQKAFANELSNRGFPDDRPRSGALRDVRIRKGLRLRVLTMADDEEKESRA